MSDDISIPRGGPVRTSFTHSYRARRTGMDVGTKRLLLAASALGLMLAAGMGVWSLTGHRAAGIPTIEADNRPLRSKPADPGGMTVIGASEQALGAGAESIGDLAPAAETPDPQALLAQQQAAAPPAKAAPVPAAPVQTAKAAATTQEPPPAPVQAAKAAVPELGSPQASAAATEASSAPPKADSNGPMVQVAAVTSEGGAATEWARLSKKLPDLLGNRQPVVQRAEHNGAPIWRLRTGGFSDDAEAMQFCRRLRAKGAGCSIANF